MDREIIIFLFVFIAGGAINRNEGAKHTANFRGLMFITYFFTLGGFLTEEILKAVSSFLS